MSEENKRVVRREDVPQNDRGGYFYQRYVTQGEGVPFNFLRIDVSGRHGKRKVLHGIRNYYVVAGEGKFVVEGEEISVSARTLITINSGESYSYEGMMELIEFNIADKDGQIEHEDLE